MEEGDTHKARTQSNVDLEDPNQVGRLSHSVVDADHDDADYVDGRSVDKRGESTEDT